MIQRIIEMIEESEKQSLYQEFPKDILSGFSGNKIIGTLQRLTNLYQDNTNNCYLEVGVFQGLTLLSVAGANPQLECFGIDNFAHHDPQGENSNIVKERIDKLNLTNANLINEDYEDALENLTNHIDSRKVGVFFIDGPHDYRSQLMCLQLVKPYLHKNAVIIIDDSNYQHVRQANRDFIKTHPSFKLVFEAYTTAHPSNMDSQVEAELRKGWWNGINIIVKDPDNLLKPIFPPTERNRQLFENEHIIHSMACAEFAPHALSLYQNLTNFRIIKSIKHFLVNMKLIKKYKKKYNKQFDSMNTYSSELSKYNINRLSSDC
jgi:tRNA G46 methylase TrmB